jgi:hypothetical protein
MSAPSPFFNVANMKQVMEELEARMEQRHFEAVNGNARGLVLEVMQDVDADRDYADMSVKEKNDVVLQASMAIIGDLSDRAAARQPDPLPPRALPAVPETGRTVETFAPYPDVPPAVTPAGEIVSADTVTAIERASAQDRDNVDKIVKEPWAPLMRPLDITMDISIDGFDRDFDSYPDRYRFQYECGNNVMNITKLTATSIQIPVTAGDVPMTLGAPYILLTFDEFSGVCDDGASNGVRKSFGKFVIDKIVGFPGARQYAYMKPASKCVREFTPPMHSLKYLNLSFTLPDGGLISRAQDTHRITSVNLAMDAAANWILQTEQNWVADFEAGDVIQIRGVNTASGRVNDYLNREEGHVVIAGGAFFEFLAQRASLVISRPYTIDPVTKRLIEDDVTQGDLAALAAPDINPPARIVNTSLQPSVSLVVVLAPSTRHEAVI